MKAVKQTGGTQNCDERQRRPWRSTQGSLYGGCTKGIWAAVGSRLSRGITQIRKATRFFGGCLCV